MPRPRLTALLLILVTPALHAQGPFTPIDIPLDSARWTLEGRAAISSYQGQRCIALNGGVAEVNGLTFRDGVIDADVVTTAARGFLGVQFRADSMDAEWIYLRPHHSGQPDAIQYTPVLHTGLNWQIYNGPGFTAAVDIPRDRWFHLRIAVAGAQAQLFVGDTVQPVLVMDDLKSGKQEGALALAVLTGQTCFAAIRVRPTPPAAWERHLPAMPPGTLTRWELSPSYDALARNLEQPLGSQDEGSMPWEAVSAEPPGFVVINRYRDSPHPRVTFQSDFSTRLAPQPGTRVVYARTTVEATHAGLRKLELGYSDEVSVFLNGRILYRGRSAQSFRDPAFLGIMNPENDAVYLPLVKGKNELLLAVSELGGGWGFIARLAPESGASR
ncbi:MAG: hypothetical protein U0133_00015 [Gemmatimonadales bacterium]